MSTAWQAAFWIYAFIALVVAVVGVIVGVNTIRGGRNWSTGQLRYDKDKAREGLFFCYAVPLLSPLWLPIAVGGGLLYVTLQTHKVARDAEIVPSFAEYRAERSKYKELEVHNKKLEEALEDQELPDPSRRQRR